LKITENGFCTQMKKVYVGSTKDTKDPLRK